MSSAPFTARPTARSARPHDRRSLLRWAPPLSSRQARDRQRFSGQRFSDCGQRPSLRVANRKPCKSATQSSPICLHAYRRICHQTAQGRSRRTEARSMNHIDRDPPDLYIRGRADRRSADLSNNGNLGSPLTNVCPVPDKSQPKISRPSSGACLWEEICEAGLIKSKSGSIRNQMNSATNKTAS